MPEPAWAFDQHPPHRERFASVEAWPIEMGIVFDGEFFAEVLFSGVTLPLTAAEANALGMTLIGMAARIAVLNAETRAEVN